MHLQIWIRSISTKMKTLSSAVTLFSVLVAVNSFSHFRDRIPNGRSIKHPCKVNYMWHGVGHKNPQGGGARNPFGEDFEKYGFEWNECLCRADSDKDGKTNGEELGDPGCQWKPGQQPINTAGLSHPGICEPVNSAKCLQHNTFLDCSIDLDLNCDAIKEPDVKNITIRFQETAVPATETTYICQAFQLPSDVNSHMIAVEGVIDNKNVMHHMVLFACTQDEEAQAWSQFSTPSACFAMNTCTDLIALWTLGMPGNGECIDDNVGYRIGTHGYRTVVLQSHWNNPEVRSDYKDSSGLTLYYTTKLRQYDAGVLATGAMSLQLPPGYKKYDVTAGCSGPCMDYILEGSPIHLVKLSPHMHYLGTSMIFEHIRDGKVLKRVEIAQFFYDNPIPVNFKEHITVMPGDELKVVCGFSTITKTDFTFYGDATSDEMCYAFLMYYPMKASASACLTHNGLGVCDPDERTMNGNISEHCDYEDFKATLSQATPEMLMKCDNTGKVCRPDCGQAIASVKNHQCLNSSAAEVIKAPLQRDTTGKGRMIMNMLVSCDPKPPVSSTESGSPSKGFCDLPTDLPPCIGDGITTCGALQQTINLFAFIAVVSVLVIL